MKLATEEVEFSFNNIMYPQVDGITIRLPLGPTLANIFVGYLEYKILPDFDLDCNYVRYVVIISNCEKVSSLLFEKMNSLYDMIKFTKEIEVNNQL